MRAIGLYYTILDEGCYKTRQRRGSGRTWRFPGLPARTHLEFCARAIARGKPTPALLAADKLRSWPRTAQTSYQAGLAEIVSPAQGHDRPRRLRSLQRILSADTGRSHRDRRAPEAKHHRDLNDVYPRRHSRTEIPELIKRESAKHPGVTIRYAGLSTCRLAPVFSQQVRKTETTAYIQAVSNSDAALSSLVSRAAQSPGCPSCRA